MGNQVKRANCLVLFFDIFAFSDSKISKSSNKIRKLIRIWNQVKEKIAISDQNHVYLFSDCGFIIYPIKDEKAKRTALELCLQQSEKLLDIYLCEGFFLRGAISIGPVYFTENLLVGDAVSEVVKMEAALCPGPFIICPKYVIKDLDLPLSFIGPKRSLTLDLKSKRERMKCIVLMPTDLTEYRRIVTQNAEKYCERGPYEYGYLWDEMLKHIDNVIRH